MENESVFSSEKSILIEDRSLSSKAEQVISDMIITGKCPQGSRLKENEIANALGISRACVREALWKLEDEGLIIRVLNKYTEVVKFSETDVKEIYVLRNVIEKICVETCIKNKTVPYDELKRQSSKMMSIKTDTIDGALKWVEEDLIFHELLVLYSENARMYKVWKNLRGQVKTLIFSAVQGIHGLITGVGSHDKIIEAIQSEDIQAVTMLLDRHIMSGCELVLGYMDSQKKV